MRLIGVILVGCLVLAAVVGSFWLARADELMTAQAPEPRWSLPTPTLYPTEAPPAAVIAKPTPTSVASRSTPVPPTETVLPTSTPESVCQIRPGWVAYVVRAGDTWESLAQKSQTNAQDLLTGNCMSTALDLRDVPLLYLPCVASVKLVPTVAVMPCRTAPVTWWTIIVARGETLWALSRRYGTTPGVLMEYNCLPSDSIQAGRSLRVPPTLVQPPTPLPTATWLPTLTATPMATPTPTPTDTPTLTPTPRPSLTPTETPVLVPTWTPVPWPWPTAPLLTPTGTTVPGTATPVPTITPAASPQPTPTASPPAATATPLPSPTPEATPTTAPTPTPLPTATPEP